MAKDYKELKGKLPIEDIDLRALELIACSLHYGIHKYGIENKNSYKNGEYETYKGAMLRHLIKHEKGIEIDAESGLPHIVSMFTNSYIALFHYLKDNPFNVDEWLIKLNERNNAND